MPQSVRNPKASATILNRSVASTPVRDKTGVPSLLVSVRSKLEALRAIDGGAQIIDIKEPSKGSLGMANINVINDIASMDQFVSDSLAVPNPLSVALGELSKWSNFSTALS